MEAITNSQLKEYLKGKWDIRADTIAAALQLEGEGRPGVRDLLGLLERERWIAKSFCRTRLSPNRRTNSAPLLTLG